MTVNITDLTAASAFTDDDLAVVVTDVAGTPTTKKITGANLAAGAAFSAVYAAPVTGSYTPTLGGMAIGTGGGATNIAYYTEVGGLMFIDGQIVFGSSGATTPAATDLTVSLPSGYELAADIAGATTYLGDAVLVDADSTDFTAHLRYVNATTLRIIHVQTAGTGTNNLGIVALSSTDPFTWTNGDGIYWHARIRVIQP